MKKTVIVLFLIALLGIFLLVAIFNKRSEIQIEINLESPNEMSQPYFNEFVMLVSKQGDFPKEHGPILESANRKLWKLETSEFSGSEIEIRERPQVVDAFKRVVFHGSFDSLLENAPKTFISVGSNVVLAQYHLSKQSFFPLRTANLFTADESRALVQSSPILPGFKSKFALLSKKKYQIDILDSNGIRRYSGVINLNKDVAAIQTLEVSLMEP